MENGKRNFDRYLERNSDKIGSVIHDLWASKDDSAWSQEPYYYIKLGETADKLGQAMFAHDILSEGLACFPGDLRLTQIFGLSLIKCGYLLKARELLTELVTKGHQDEETLGILGRVYKEMWLIAGDSDSLGRSRDLYLKAFVRNRGNYSGINAASLSFILGEREKAAKLARLVIKICFELIRSSKQRDYWVTATLGEAFLLLGRMEEAAKYYSLARRQIKKNFSDLASTRRQLILLSDFTDVPAELAKILVVPPVAAFTGHMIDSADRRTRRFSPDMAGDVKQRIQIILKELGIEIGYSSAACGSDVIFLECIQDRVGETNVILPFDRKDFFSTSVEHAGDDWVNRTRKALEKTSQIEQVTPGRYGGDDLLFSYANRIIMGKTILRSRFLETDPLLLVVWDGKKTGRPGGTSEFIETWEANGYPIKVIDIGAAGARTAAVPGSAAPTAGVSPSGKKGVKREIVSILFADLVGYSRLTEEQVPHYVEGFLGVLAERFKSLRHKPVFKNIWGDALFFVFRDHRVAAEFALNLRDVVRETDWKSLHLPEDLAIRIGLHVGPVYSAREPIQGQVNFFGSHVNQAARIEPITSPGNVYASEAFASLLIADENTQLDCRYVGIIVLPKKFGRYPIYHVKRKNEIE